MDGYFLAILFGGALGSVVRWRVGAAVAARYAGPFPLGTFLINVTGSFAIGFVSTALGLAPERAFSNDLTGLLVTGFLGGYTTFSSYELDTYALATGAHRRLWPAYWVGSVVLGLGAAWLGHLLGDVLAAAR